jgi:hypothetical protein
VARRRAPKGTSFTAGLERFESFTVQQGAAALALWPANADRHVAVSALIDAAAPLDRSDTGEPMRREHWRRWLTSRSSKLLREVRPDGVHDEPLSVQAVIRGSRRALLAGALESADLQFGIWSTALDDVPSCDDDPALAGAQAVLQQAAALCERAVTVSGLGGMPWPDHSAERRIVVPDAAAFGRLVAAVTIPTAELESRAGLIDALSPLIRDRSGLHRRPLARGPADELLLADPWRFTRAALVESVAQAARSPQTRLLLENVSTRALEVAVEAVEDMDWQVESDGEGWVLARADVDCLVLVGVHVLEPFRSEAPEYGDAAVDALSRHAQELKAHAENSDAAHALLAVVADGRPVVLPAEHELLRTEPTAPWVLGLHDLRLLGDGLRRDPLALPAALQRLPNRHWPDELDLVDVVGVHRRLEELPHDAEQLPRDGTEHLWLRARVMAARHPAPGWEGQHWRQVTRWAGSPDDAIFGSRELDRFGLLVRAPGRAVWILCAENSAGRHSLAGTICAAVAHWAARLLERDWLLEPVSRAGAEPVARVDVELLEGDGPALALHSATERIRLVIGPSFVWTLCQGDNTSDRMLVQALLAAFEDRPPADAAALLDAVAPAGHGTFVIWPTPETRENAPRLDPPPLVAPRDRRAVGAQLAAHLVPRDRIVALGAEHAKPGIDDLQRVLDGLVAGRLRELAPEALIETVALNERALLQTAVEAVGLPARAALRDADDHLGPRESTGARNLALRALVERLSAAAPTGTQPLSARRAGWLRAACELQIELGSASDALHSGATSGNVVVGADVGVLVNLDGPLPTASQKMQTQYERVAPELMVLEHSEWWTNEPVPAPQLQLDQPIALDDPRWEELDRALRDEWQVGFEELLRLLRALSEIADAEPRAVAVAAADALAGELSDVTAIRASTVREAIRRLTLGSCSDYEITGRSFRPWRPNRDRSYLRRPLVELPDGRLCWSAMAVLLSARYLHALIETKRLEAGPAVSRAMENIAQVLARDFERAVLERVEAAGWSARLRVKRLARRPLERTPGQPIGDIDVLAWSAFTREVWLLDAKRLAPGLQAGAMTREARAVAKHAEHHLERLRWVEAHPDALAAELGLPDHEQLQVRAALVIDTPLVGVHLLEVGLPVWTIWELEGQLCAPLPTQP